MLFGTYLLLWTAYVFIATTLVFSKLTISVIPPFFTVSVRMITAGLLMILLHLKESKEVLYKDFKDLIYTSVFQIFISFNCEIWALRYIPMFKMQLLYNLTPFVTIALLYFVKNEKTLFSSKQLLAVFVASLTICTTLNVSHENLLPSTSDIVLLVAIISGAHGWILFQNIVKKGRCVAAVNGVNMLLGGIMSLLLSVCTEKIEPISAESIKTVTLTIGALILISNIFFYNAYGFLLKTCNPILLALAGQSTPIFAAIYGKIIFNESLNVKYIVAFVVLILAILVFEIEEKGKWGRSDSN